jgi:hypothetical protein
MLGTRKIAPAPADHHVVKSTPIPVRAVYGLLAAGLIAHGFNAITGPGDWPFPGAITTYLYQALMVLGSLLAIASVVRRRRERLAWSAISLGLVLWTAGDIIWSAWIGKLDNPPYPSVSDFLYLASYGAIYAGVALLLRARVRPIRGAQWVDGMVGCLAISAVAAAALFPAFTGLTEGNPTEVAVNLSYPVCDLLLLSFVALALGLNRWRMDRSWVLLGLGQVMNVVGDVVYAYQDAAGTYVVGSWIDTMWPLGVACRSPPPSPPRRSACCSPASSPTSTPPRPCWPPPRWPSPACAAGCSSATTCACCTPAGANR